MSRKTCKDIKSPNGFCVLQEIANDRERESKFLELTKLSNIANLFIKSPAGKIVCIYSEGD